MQEQGPVHLKDRNQQKDRSDARRNVRGSDATFGGTQGLLRGETFVGFNAVFCSDQRVLVLKRAADLQETFTFGGQSGFAWPVSPSARPVPLRGLRATVRLKTKTFC